MDFDLPCRTSPRWCSRGSPGGWFWNLSKYHLKINTKERFKEKKDDMILNLDSAFLVEFHLDDVLEVHLVVGSEIYQNTTWR